MGKPTVFISYSHKDEQWKDLLLPHLKMLGDDRIAIWDDRKIDPGGEWFVEIQQVMKRATVSVCLINHHHLRSPSGRLPKRLTSRVCPTPVLNSSVARKSWRCSTKPGNRRQPTSSAS